MPFGMSWDEFKRQAAGAKSGDQAARKALKAGAGLHVHPAAKVAIGLGAAAVGGTALGAAAAAGLSRGSMDTRGLGLTSFGGVGTGGTSGVTAPTGGGGGGFLGTLIGLGTEWVAGQLGGGGGGGALVQEECRPGTVRVMGKCVSPGDAFPGGEPFIVPAGGGSVNGGLASQLGGRTPAIVGSVNGNPIRRCQAGWVLAIDDNCYHRKILPRQFRKWAPAKRAKISAHDWKMMNKYGPGGSKQKKVKEIAQAAGFACKKK
jgi:hypothetical protein